MKEPSVIRPLLELAASGHRLPIGAGLRVPDAANIIRPKVKVMLEA